MQKPFYSREDLISFGIFNGHIYNEIKKGKLIFRKSGRRLLISHDELMRYLDGLPIKSVNAA